MVTFFTVTLAVSIAGLIGLVGLKQWEMQTGRVALRGVRPAIGHWLSNGLHFVERIAPSAISNAVRRLWAIGRTLFHRYVAWGVLWTEAKLESTLNRLRGATTTTRISGSEVSEFLQEVARHKKKLLKRPKEDRAIHEE